MLLFAFLPALLPHAARAKTQTDTTTVSLNHVTLPAGALPPHARIQRKSVGNVAASTASGLHTRSFTDLKRVKGLVQTATWRPVTRQGAREGVPNLQYAVSIFQSPIAAATAYGDARASLWELGSPTSIGGLTDPAFTVVGRNRTDVYVVFHRSVVEAELRLRYGRVTSKEGAKLGVAALGHAVQTALHLVVQATQTVPVLTSARPAALPPIFAAPWGVGPIVKSPSLMGLPDATTDPNVPADPGAFRPTTNPPLAASTLPVAALTPQPGLARFVRITHGAGPRTEWYDSGTLYESPARANAAFAALDTTNRSRHGLRRLQSPGLPTTDDVAVWQMAVGMVLAFRTGNLLTVLAGTASDRDVLTGIGLRVIATIPTWLHTSGTTIMDATDHPVHISALNWYGAEQQDFVVGGLDYQPYQTILQTVQQLGYNTIRLPFSDQLVQQNPIVTAHVAANRELSGLHALDVIDRIVGYAGALGLSVILDNHRSEAGWSSEESGLWYSGPYTDAVFVHDWTTMAARYAVNNVVIGTDLRNEPHAAATWGDGNAATDWHAAAERAGDAVLSANQHVLVMVEGVQFYGTAPSAWWGENLMGVAVAPVSLQFPDGTPARDRLVYSAHDYGPDMCGGGCPWFNPTANYDTLSQVWDQFWGYIAADPTKPYAAPVWIGEFGTCNYREECVTDATPGSQGQWFTSFIRYLAERHLGWSYWSANGTQSTGGQRVYGALDWYGLLRRDWTGPVPWVHDALSGILNDTGPAQSGTSAPG